MSTDKLRSARGDVVSVTVQPDSDRPYLIALAGHRFSYEVAITPNRDRAALGDLRLVANDHGTAIATADLMAVPVDRLARIAAKHARRDDGEHDRAAADRLSAALAERFGLDPDQAAVSVSSHETPGPVMVPGSKPKGRGRPAKSASFYARVADAARAAATDPERRSIARGVQARAATWPEYDTPPPLSTVERWLKQARALGLYTGPRSRPTHLTHEETDQ
ncbi:hypothetical protein HQ314_00105 [Rhodococcus sp. BP-332]|uniref:hypothetical protein n=1 Tax=Rhodococcus sp. BP-332 TaxID=2739447 RepID=UPI001C9AA317|nr:hypothetical protein [Rhodococcus sp. BP-332]MBY6675317.1 hypothetical protein [Rhodococcus sp. BP-332]